MRLQVLETGHRPIARLFIRTVERVSRQPIDPVVKVSLHRPEFFGRPFLAMVADTLRGHSYWTAAEREAFAAYTSRLNECPFCVQVHTEASRIEGGTANVEHASLRPAIAAVLPLLDKASAGGDAITKADVDLVREQGVPDDAIVDALYVNLLFNTINRLANSFDLRWESDAHARLAARVIHRIRYRLPPFVI